MQATATDPTFGTENPEAPAAATQEHPSPAEDAETRGDRSTDDNQPAAGTAAQEPTPETAAPAADAETSGDGSAESTNQQVNESTPAQPEVRIQHVLNPRTGERRPIKVKILRGGEPSDPAQKLIR